MTIPERSVVPEPDRGPRVGVLVDADRESDQHHPQYIHAWVLPEQSDEHGARCSSIQVRACRIAAIAGRRCIRRLLLRPRLAAGSAGRRPNPLVPYPSDRRLSHRENRPVRAPCAIHSPQARSRRITLDAAFGVQYFTRCRISSSRTPHASRGCADRDVERRFSTVMRRTERGCRVSGGERCAFGRSRPGAQKS